MNDHEVARAVALAAGAAILQTQQEIVAKLKGDIDEPSRTALGIAGDRRGQEVSAELLQQLRPSDAVLSEEGFHDSARHGVDRLWIIDPLDGTANYSRGGEEFAIHVALWVRGSDAPSEITAACVFVPHTQELLSMDDVRPEQPGTEAEVQPAIRLLVSRSRKPKELDVLVEGMAKRLSRNIETISMSSVGAKVAAIIRGDADLYVNTGGFHEWDLAAPLGIAHHYGLSVCDRNGATISFNQSETQVPNAVISRPQFVAAVIDSLA